jgi:DNA-binding NtrC family response regulator
MEPARLVVCERTGYWAVALRRELGDAGVRVWETRLLADCGAMLSDAPSSFSVLELNEGKIGELLDFITSWQSQFPLFRFAVVAHRNLDCYQWLMREAGAVDFISSPRKVDALAQAACRHLAQMPALPQSLTERIWANLPWGR